MNGRMTDRQFLLAVLSDGKPHTLHEILLASVRERGHAFTVHSRAADLRKLGYTVACKPMPRKRGSVYQLVTRPLEEVASTPLSPATSPSGSVSPDATPALDGRSEGVADEPLEQLALTVPRTQSEQDFGRGRAASGKRAA